MDKTKIISHTRYTRPGQNLIIEDDCIEAVTGFTYLGATISDDGNEEAELRRSITLANRCV